MMEECATTLHKVTVSERSYIYIYIYISPDPRP